MSQPVARGRTDSASMEMKAAPEALYAAFSDADRLMAWLPPGDMSGRALEYDFREGGRYRIALTYAESAPGNVGKTTDRTDISAGRFITLEPGRRIVQSVEFETTDDTLTGEMTMTWRFEPTASGTEVTITAENVPPGISQADHAAGLRSSLDNLRNFID